MFGGGPYSAEIVFIGESGDRADRQGRPFPGPSGKPLDRAPAGAGSDRSTVYATNAVKHFKFAVKHFKFAVKHFKFAVKHFKFEERGRQRLYKKPSGLEIRACRRQVEYEKFGGRKKVQRRWKRLFEALKTEKGYCIRMGAELDRPLNGNPRKGAKKDAQHFRN